MSHPSLPAGGDDRLLVAAVLLLLLCEGAAIELILALVYVLMG